jgi:hypothetical protein
MKRFLKEVTTNPRFEGWGWHEVGGKKQCPGRKNNVYKSQSPEVLASRWRQRQKKPGDSAKST